MMKKKNAKKMKALTAAVQELNDNGINLTTETQQELEDRLNYLSGLHEPIRLEASAITEGIADAYFRRNKVKRSVIIFQIDGGDYPGSSTVIMPDATADENQVFDLVEAVRKIVTFDHIFIDDLYDQPSQKPEVKDCLGMAPF